MSNLVIIAIGTRGDVAPVAGLGARLAERGHRVVFATLALFADLITDTGMEFRQLGDPVTVEDLSEELGGLGAIKMVMAAWSPTTIRSLARSAFAALRDEPADALLFSPYAEPAAQQLAEARQIPAIGLRLQPLSTSRAYPPAVLGGWSAGRLGNRLAGRISCAVCDRLYNHAIADLRTELDLPKISARRLRRARTAAGWRILYGYSPTVVPRPDDWRDGIDVTGYWWPPTPPDWQPPAELQRFLADGPPPVFIGFGSVLTLGKQAARLSAAVTTSVHELGVRAVLQAGWAGLASTTSADVLTIGEVPHEWLFPRTAAVVHHCGAGTTAAGLRAGVPAIGAPLIGDQSFWAKRLRILGVSTATLSQRTLTARKLTKALAATLDDAQLAARARSLAARLTAEDGIGTAANAIEDAITSRLQT